MDLFQTGEFLYHFARIDAELSGTLSNKILKGINGCHVLASEGRLRALLFILSCNLCEYNGSDIYYFSTIFEYIYNAFMLHDYVIQNSTNKGDKATYQSASRNLGAVISGDFFCSKYFAIAVESKSTRFLRMITSATDSMVKGQFLELLNKHNWRITKDQYMKIVTYRFASLISVACACGAIFAGAQEEVVHILKQFGLNLGTAIQLVDDLRDYLSCEKDSERLIVENIRKGKITLPLIYTLSNLGKSEIDSFKELFTSDKAEDGDYKKIIEMTRNKETIDLIRSEAKLYLDKGSRFLNFFPDSLAKHNLIQIGSSCLERSYLW